MSIKALAAGSVILIGGLLSVLFLLPRVTPYDILNCSPFEGGTQCFGSLNPVYPVVFMISMAGSVVLFFGMFGRRFVLGPLYMIGMLLLGWGSAGVTFGYLGLQWCVSQPFALSCIAYHSEFYTPAIVAGMTLIGGNYLWWWRGLSKKPVAIRLQCSASGDSLNFPSASHRATSFLFLMCTA